MAAIEKRGSGETTRQMREAPEKAVFVCPTHSTTYYKALARHLNRDDLEIRPADVFLRDGNIFRGRRISALVLDHAFVLRPGSEHGYMAACASVRK